MPTPGKDIEKLPFESAIQELEEIVAKLESAGVSLDESVQLYARGEALRKRCEALLQDAEARVQKINLTPEGEVKGASPLDVE